jgi:hypothetical protein
MQHVVTVAARQASAELIRRGFKLQQVVRLVVDRDETDEPPVTAINAAGGGFDWLADARESLEAITGR